MALGQLTPVVLHVVAAFQLVPLGVEGCLRAQRMLLRPPVRSVPCESVVGQNILPCFPAAVNRHLFMNGANFLITLPKAPKTRPGMSGPNWFERVFLGKEEPETEDEPAERIRTLTDRPSQRRLSLPPSMPQVIELPEEEEEEEEKEEEEEALPQAAPRKSAGPPPLPPPSCAPKTPPVATGGSAAAASAAAVPEVAMAPSATSAAAEKKPTKKPMLALDKMAAMGQEGEWATRATTGAGSSERWASLKRLVPLSSSLTW